MLVFFIVSAVVILLLAPIYFCFALIALIVLAVLSDAIGRSTLVLMMGVIVIGWLWVVVKISDKVCTWINRPRNLHAAVRQVKYHPSCHWKLADHTALAYLLLSIDRVAKSEKDIYGFWLKATEHDLEYGRFNVCPAWRVYDENLREGHYELLAHGFYVPEVLSFSNNDVQKLWRKIAVEAVNWMIESPSERRRVLALYDAAVHSSLSTAEKKRISSGATQEHPVTNNGANDDKDGYALLEVDASCTDAELAAAYKRKVKQWHPDRLAEMAPELKEFANRELARFNLAYETLVQERKVQC